MSVFADKLTSPRDHPFWLDDNTNFRHFSSGRNSLFGHDLDDDDYLSSDMRLRNGSLPSEGGFYNHFDSVFHGITIPRSRRHELRTAADSSRRQKGKEYIIPITIETTPKVQTTKNTDESFKTSATRKSPGDRVIEIPIVRENSTKLNWDARPEPVSATRLHFGLPAFTPTTEEFRKSQKRNSNNDIELDSDAFFARPLRSSLQNTTRLRPESKDIEIVGIDTGRSPSSRFRKLTPTTDQYKPLKTSDNDVILDSDDFFQTPRTSKANRCENDVEFVGIENGDDSMRSLRRRPLRNSSLFAPSTHLLQNPASARETPKKILSSLKPKDAAGEHRTIERDGEHKPTSACCHPERREVTDAPSYPIYDYLKPELFSQDRQLDYIRGDGNCFFRALSKDVYGSEEFHAECRQAVCDLVEKHPDVFQQFIDHSSVTSHVADMRAHASWATTCEIYAAATLLGREIYVLVPSPSSNAEYHWLLFSPRSLSKSGIGAAETESKACYITLCHTNANHYDLISPISVPCNCQLPLPSLNGVSVMLDLTCDKEDITRKE